MLAIRSSPNQLIVRLGYHAGETCYLTLAECDEPKQVRAGERELERVDRLADARRAWHFDAARGLTIVRLEFPEAEELLEFRF